MNGFLLLKTEFKISNKVYHYSMKVLYIIHKLNYKLVNNYYYCTSYKTVIIEFYKDYKIFSLEIGKNSIGYFIESKTGDLKLYVDSLLIFEKRKDLEKFTKDFLNFLEHK